VRSCGEGLCSIFNHERLAKPEADPYSYSQTYILMDYVFCKALVLVGHHLDTNVGYSQNLLSTDIQTTALISRLGVNIRRELRLQAVAAWTWEWRWAKYFCLQIFSDFLLPPCLGNSQSTRAAWESQNGTQAYQSCQL
jgi:hypothetical protein